MAKSYSSLHHGAPLEVKKETETVRRGQVKRECFAQVFRLAGEEKVDTCWEAGGTPGGRRQGGGNGKGLGFA
jgi:hypothetical protein